MRKRLHKMSYYHEMVGGGEGGSISQYVKPDSHVTRKSL